LAAAVAVGDHYDDLHFQQQLNRALRFGGWLVFLGDNFRFEGGGILNA
jgi:hypothetical protein